MNRTLIAPWACVGVTVALLLGCAASSAPKSVDRARDTQRSMLSEKGQALTVEELDQLTNGFADRYFTYHVSAIEKILAGNTDARQIRRAQQVRLVQMNAIYDIVTNADPLTQVIDLTLVVTLQSQKWIDEDMAGDWFGERGQHLALASRRAREDIWRIAERVLKPEQLEQFDYMIWQWRKQNPGIEIVSYVRFDDFAAGRGRSMVADVKSGGGLLAPVDEAKKAVDEVRLLAERAFFLGKRMPFLLNWQIEAAVSGITADPQIRSATDSVALATKSIERATALAERLPGEISKQHAELIASIEKQHPMLMTALGQYRGAIGDTGKLVGAANELTHVADTLLKTVQETAKTLDTTIAGIDKAFLRPGSGEPSAPGKPFDIAEYARTALALTGTLQEANALLASAGGMLGITNDARLEHATTKMLDALLWRAMVLVAWFFGLLLVYRLIASWLARKR